jgi:hypothetical protein
MNPHSPLTPKGKTMPRTDSAIVEYNEDGSRTITTVETIMPATKKQQAAAYSALGLLTLAPLMPLAALYLVDKYEARMERKAEAKRLKSVK